MHFLAVGRCMAFLISHNLGNLTVVIFPQLRIAPNVEEAANGWANFVPCSSAGHFAIKMVSMSAVDIVRPVETSHAGFSIGNSERRIILSAAAIHPGTDFIAGSHPQLRAVAVADGFTKIDEVAPGAIHFLIVDDVDGSVFVGPGSGYTQVGLQTRVGVERN